MEKINNFDFKKEVVLDSNGVLEFEIIDNISELGISGEYFNYIRINGDLIEIERQGYNNPGLGTLVFNLEGLADNQKNFVIKTVYKYVFYKTGDLIKRVNQLAENPNAQSHDGILKTFFVCHNDSFSEYQIAEAIKQEMPNFFESDYVRDGVHLNP